MTKESFSGLHLSKMVLSESGSRTRIHQLFESAFFSVSRTLSPFTEAEKTLAFQQSPLTRELRSGRRNQMNGLRFCTHLSMGGHLIEWRFGLLSRRCPNYCRG
jgi:hypothetical protein